MSESLCEPDINELSSMLTTALPHHPITERRLMNGLFRHAGFDAALARVERGKNGGIDSAVAAILLPDKDGRKRAQLLFVATRRELRRRGLAGGLYAEVETELRRRGVQDVTVSSGVISSGLDLRYTATVTMLLRRLYVSTRVVYDQTLDPDVPIPSERDAPEGFIVRDLTPSDISALDALCTQEFPGCRYSSGLINAGACCGVAGAFEQATGELAAFAGYSEYIFGPTGTAKRFRRRGLGESVFWLAVRAIKAGIPDVPVLIACANIGYYSRAFGCHICGVIWDMNKDLTADPAISKGK